jgi:hypothetical protein
LSLVTSAQVPLQSVVPASHEHEPQAQLALHFCVPLPSHACVVLGAQAPLPVQVDQADQAPSLHVLVCVPQLPHACDEGPLHAHCPPLHVEPDGQA